MPDFLTSEIKKQFQRFVHIQALGGERDIFKTACQGRKTGLLSVDQWKGLPAASGIPVVTGVLLRKRLIQGCIQLLGTI